MGRRDVCGGLRAKCERLWTPNNILSQKTKPEHVSDGTMESGEEGRKQFSQKLTLEISPMVESDSSLPRALALVRLFLSPSAWGHSASCRRIHYLFVYRPQLPVLVFDVIRATFFLFSFYYVILLFPHSLFGPELSPLFFLSFFFRLTHFSLFISLAVYFIMQKLQNWNLLLTLTLRVEQHSLCHSMCDSTVDVFLVLNILFQFSEHLFSEKCLETWSLSLKSSSVFIQTIIQYFWMAFYLSGTLKLSEGF